MSLRHCQAYTLEAMLAGLLFLLLLSQTFNNLTSQPFHSLGSAEQTFSLFPRHLQFPLAGQLGVCPGCDQPEHTLPRDPPWPPPTPGTRPMTTWPGHLLPRILRKSAQKQVATDCSLKQTSLPVSIFSAPLLSLFHPVPILSAIPASVLSPAS